MSPEEFEAIYRQHRDLVWAMICRNVFSASDREDIFMETWEAVWDSLPGYTGKCKLSTWIASIARNKCFDYLRKRRPETLPDAELVRLLDALGGRDGLPPIFPRPPLPPDAQAIKKELRELARKVLEELPPMQKFAVEKQLDGLSYRGIAELWNASHSDPVNASHIGKQIYLAKARLARALKSAGINSWEDLWE